MAEKLKDELLLPDDVRRFADGISQAHSHIDRTLSLRDLSACKHHSDGEL